MYKPNQYKILIRDLAFYQRILVSVPAHSPARHFEQLISSGATVTREYTNNCYSIKGINNFKYRNI